MMNPLGTVFGARVEREDEEDRLRNVRPKTHRKPWVGLGISRLRAITGYVVRFK